MSRIGKKLIIIPDKVTVVLRDSFVIVTGPRGELSFVLPQGIGIIHQGNQLQIEITAKDINAKRASWGTARSVIANMTKGVVEGFEKKLELEGIGYKAQSQGQDLVLQLGFSHPVEVKALEGITFKVEKNVITVSGMDKILVGEVAANIRKLKKPEPYKGKGIHYQGEVVRRKAGKKAMGSA